MVKVILDNAQSGGPVIKIKDHEHLVGTIYPRAEDKEMIYWDMKDPAVNNPDEIKRKAKLSDMPEKDGIVLYDDE